MTLNYLNFIQTVILLDNGKVTFNGSISNLESQLNDVQKYRFTFKRIVPSEFLKVFKNNNKVKNVISKDCNVQVSISDKSEFLKFLIWLLIMS